MVEKNVEEKVKVINDYLELLNAPLGLWVEINGRNELKINNSGEHNEVKYDSKTLSLSGNYVCERYYDAFLGSLKPVYIEKVFKETGKGRELLKIIRENIE